MGLAPYLPLPQTSFLMPSQGGRDVHASEKQPEQTGYLGTEQTWLKIHIFELLISQLGSIHCSYMSTTKEK